MSKRIQQGEVSVTTTPSNVTTGQQLPLKKHKEAGSEQFYRIKLSSTRGLFILHTLCVIVSRNQPSGEIDNLRFLYTLLPAFKITLFPLYVARRNTAKKILGPKYRDPELYVVEEVSLSFGKYGGYTIRQLYEKNWHYLKWLCGWRQRRTSKRVYCPVQEAIVNAKKNYPHIDGMNKLSKPYDDKEVAIKVMEHVLSKGETQIFAKDITKAFAYVYINNKDAIFAARKFVALGMMCLECGQLCTSETYNKDTMEHVNNSCTRDITIG
jgi:hypothetical protein